MLNFNLKKAAIFQAVRQVKNPIFAYADFIRKISLILFSMFSAIFLYGSASSGVFPEDISFGLFSIKALSKLSGMALIFLSFSVIFWLIKSFFISKLKAPQLEIELGEAIKNPEKHNIAEFFCLESAAAVWRAKNNTTRLFYNLVSNYPELNFIFHRGLINPKAILKNLEQYLSSVKQSAPAMRTASSSLPSSSARFPKETSLDFQTALLDSCKIAAEKGRKRVGPGDVISSLAKNDPFFKKILIETNLKAEDIENLATLLEQLNERIEQRKKFWEWGNLLKFGSLGRDWAAGYTLTLDIFSTDISKIVRRKNFPQIIGHQKAISQLERTLSRKEINNGLIVGEPGSGRKSIVEGLAAMAGMGQSSQEIAYKRIVQLDLLSLLARTRGPEEFEATLDTIFREAVTAGNIILVIDEFHNFIGGHTRPGAADISAVLFPYLSIPSFQLLTITSYEGLHKNIETNPSLLNLFEKVEVSGVSEQETLSILGNLALLLEVRYKKFISYPALRDIVKYCAKYSPSLAFPEKAINLLNETAAHLVQTGDKVLLPKHVAEVFSEKVQIPVGEMETKEKEVLLKLEKLIHQRIVDQEEAVVEVSTALRRARAEISARARPMGSFLFLGPTGVGKTETSKALAEFYFGSEKRMIRLDMSEFQRLKDIPRLLGSFGEEGLLTTPVRENPFSVILLDEIEKAHPNILNLFLQIFDEGFVTDGLGRKVIFRDSIIIATSNAGYQVILKAIEEKVEWATVKQKILAELFDKATFRPEFINRFDAVVVFRPLDKNNLLQIAGLMLNKIKKGLKEKEIEFVITEPLKQKIAELSYDPKFGAREMRRVIQDKVENVLATALLSDSIKRGDTIELDPKTFQIIKK